MSNSTETPLPHETAARTLIQQFHAMVIERMPDLTIIPAAERRRLNAVASLPDDFLETIAVTVEETPEVGAPNRLTALEVRDLLVFSRVYYAFADQLEELVQNIRATVLSRRHEVGQRALGVYGIAKSVNRRSGKQFVPNVPTMRRTLGRVGRKKTEAPVPPEKEVPATQSK